MRLSLFLRVCLLGLAIVATGQVRVVVAQDAAGIEFFEKRIRPVLVTHCYECHSAGKKKQGGLLLDSRAAIRRGGDSGPGVVPGKPGESQLIDALRYESFEMPPKGKLSKAVIADFVKWIRIGAPDPREGNVDPAEDSAESYEEARQHWSYQPIERLPAPTVRAGQWPRSDIDRFVLAKLEANDLVPADDASREVLLRRATFVLTGLPPTPDEIADFLNDSSSRAFEKVVDRLLESQRFGERFARHWLDVVRFSESSGGGRTRIFKDAWRYRDYVIGAFNEDKPFDRFVTEQIAGDLLTTDSEREAKAALSATSMLAIGPINYELQDKELLDMEVVDEQLTVIGKAFLGMTIGCARCHDHKFDPIPTRDYYALAGILKSTKTLNHSNVSNPVMRSLPLNDRQKERAAAHKARLVPLQKQVKELEAQLKALSSNVDTSQKSVPHERVAGLFIDETQARLVGNWTVSTSEPVFVGSSYHHSRDPNAEAHYEFTPDGRGRAEVRLSYTAHANRGSNITVEVWHADGRTVRTVNMKRRPIIDGTFYSLGTFEFDGELKVLIKARGANGAAIADGVQLLVLKDGQKAAELASLKDSGKQEPDRDALATRKSLEKALAEKRKELKDVEKLAPPPVPVVMSVEEAGQPGDCHLCIRGNVHNQGAEIPRGFLSVITGDNAPAIPDDVSGRRELAAWIASPDNALTSRVIANRVWYWLTGVGLVRTTDNLGTTGELPSHPELLDWLATELTTNDWSLRHLIRTIVLSRTWQLSVEPDADALRIDPDNRLLSHMPRRRLEAEAIRDAILSVSGQLDLTMGGTTIRPGSNTEFNYRFNDVNLDGRRRSVYVPVFRNTLLDLFEVFDFADPNLPKGHRTSSTLPTQGLYLMNSPWVMQQAEHTARRLLEVEGLSDAERVEHAYLIMFGRHPTPTERGLAQDFLSAESGVDERSTVAAWSEFCHVLIASIDFRHLK